MDVVEKCFNEKLGKTFNSENIGSYIQELKTRYGFTTYGEEIIQFEADQRSSWTRYLIQEGDKRPDYAKQVECLNNQFLAERDKLLYGGIIERGVAANLAALKLEDKVFFESMLPVFEATRDDRMTLAGQLRVAKVGDEDEQRAYDVPTAQK